MELEEKNGEMSFSEFQKWVHTVFAATSMAFFLALFSASSDVVDSTLLLLSSICWSVSLATNSIMSVVISILSGNENHVKSAIEHKHFQKVLLVCYIAFSLAVTLLMFYFSSIIGCAFLLALIASGLAFYTLIKDESKK
ncbi:hypothetical protein [Vibrio jasicida]|uniref:hypothetical protein n=1 Tax=Vibrio jasicida TaxID=766224 RepID=UPI000CE4DDAE|nr:hypothetical protein [Vibrio jasicida]